MQTAVEPDGSGEAEDPFGGFETNQAVYERALRLAGWNLHTPLTSQDHSTRQRYRVHAGCLIDLCDSLLKRHGWEEGYKLCGTYGNVGEVEKESVLIKVAFVVCMKYLLYEDRESRVAHFIYENERAARRGITEVPLPLMDKLH